jgi:hypothetical protein
MEDSKASENQHEHYKHSSWPNNKSKSILHRRDKKFKMQLLQDSCLNSNKARYLNTLDKKEKILCQQLITPGGLTTLWPPKGGPTPLLTTTL